MFLIKISFLLLSNMQVNPAFIDFTCISLMIFHLLISFITLHRISLITIYSSHITSVANSPSSFTAKTFSIALT